MQLWDGSTTKEEDTHSSRCFLNDELAFVLINCLGASCYGFRQNFNPLVLFIMLLDTDKIKYN